MNITNHFSLEEFGKAIPNSYYIGLTRLACCLELIRSVVNDVTYIISSYRSEQHNTDVGGVATSYHLTCDAADIKFSKMSIENAFKLLYCNSNRLVLCKKIILDVRPNRLHLHVEGRRPNDNDPISFLIEDRNSFRNYAGEDLTGLL